MVLTVARNNCQTTTHAAEKMLLSAMSLSPLPSSAPPSTTASINRCCSGEGSLSEEEIFHPGDAADHDVLTPADIYAEAKAALQSRVADGRLSVGDYSNKTRLVERIGGGSFGEVYLGETDSGTKVAVKVELASCPFVPSCLLHEGDVYRKLAGCAGIPNVSWFGMHGSDYSALVMDLLGPTLYGAWSKLGQQFSMKTLLMIVDQTLETITDVHSRGFVHRDISPSNFMLGPTRDRVFLIDLGQAKRVVNKLVLASRQRLSVARPVVGTPRFASIFAHAGLEPSFRDDLEALGYMWVYLARGRLPWQGIRDCGGQAKIARIGQLKATIPFDELCEGLPIEFCEYLTYVRSLRPHDKPDYATIRQIFRALGERLGVEYDWKFDWMSEEESSADGGIIERPVDSDVEQPSDVDNNSVPLVTPISK